MSKTRSMGKTGSMSKPRSRWTAIARIFSGCLGCLAAVAAGLACGFFLPAMAESGGNPWLTPLLPQPHKYWHPPVVHFPIVLTLAECACLFLFLRKGDVFFDRAARLALYLTALVSLPVALAGLHDSGVDLGGSNAWIEGFKDRMSNFFNGGDVLSVHVMYVLIFLVLLYARTIWRAVQPAVLTTRARWPFIASSILVSLVVLAAAQAGGVMSHK